MRVGIQSVMRLILCFCITSISLFLHCAYAQTTNSLKTIDGNLKINLSDPKLHFKSEQYKIFKDSIKSLNRIRKNHLNESVELLNQIPIEKESKVRLKSLFADIKMYESRISELDSIILARNQIESIKASEELTSKHINEVLEKTTDDVLELKKLYVQEKQIKKWIEECKIIEKDSVVNENFGRWLKKNSNRINWKELGINKEYYLKGYAKYKTVLQDTVELTKVFSDSVNSARLKEYSEITEPYFESYDEYVMAKQNLKVVQQKVKEADKYQHLINDLLNGNSEATNVIGQALEERIKKVREVRDISEALNKTEKIEQRLRDQFDEVSYKTELENKYNEHVDKKYNREEVVKTATEKLLPLLDERLTGNSNGVKLARQGLESYQKKYLKYQNSNGEIIKERKSSLSDKKFSERLKIGGYLQLNRLDKETNLDCSPILGYYINKNMLYGIGGTYRITLRDVGTSENEEFGIRTYFEYYVGSIFAHAEYETLYHSKYDYKTDRIEKFQSPGVLVGIGGEYSISNNFRSSLMVLYNFLHNNHSPYSSPLIFRVGFNFSKIDE